MGSETHEGLEERATHGAQDRRTTHGMALWTDARQAMDIKDARWTVSESNEIVFFEIHRTKILVIIQCETHTKPTPKTSSLLRTKIPTYSESESMTCALRQGSITARSSCFTSTSSDPDEESSSSSSESSSSDSS